MAQPHEHHGTRRVNTNVFRASCITNPPASVKVNTHPRHGTAQGSPQRTSRESRGHHPPCRSTKRPSQTTSKPSQSPKSRPRWSEPQKQATMVGTATDWQSTSPHPSRTSDRFFSPGFFCFRGLALPPSLPTMLVNDDSRGSRRSSGVGGKGEAACVSATVDGSGTSEGWQYLWRRVGVCCCRLEKRNSCAM